MADLPKGWHDYYSLFLKSLEAQTATADSISGVLDKLSLNVGTVESGTVETSFGDISSVASGITTTLTTYTAGGPTRFKVAEVSGTNIATYTVLVNDVVINKKQTFYGYLDNDFQFSKGYPLLLGDIVKVQVVHNQPSLGAFSAFILVLKDEV